MSLQQRKVPDPDASFEEIARFLREDYTGDLVADPCPDCSAPLHIAKETLTDDTATVRLDCSSSRCDTSVYEDAHTVEKWARAKLQDAHADRELARLKRGERP